MTQDSRMVDNWVVSTDKKLADDSGGSSVARSGETLVGCSVGEKVAYSDVTMVDYSAASMDESLAV